MANVKERRSLVGSALVGAAILGVVALAAGCASHHAADETVEDQLIGGREVSVTLLPSVVDIARMPRAGLPTTSIPLAGSCTAAHVGPRRLLLAAHCVLDPATVSPIYKAHDAVAMLRRAADGWTEGHVERVEIHPKWLAECDRTYCAASVVTAKMDAPDVAVIVLEREIPDSAIAPVDDEALEGGDMVIVTGFGCTAGVHVKDTRTEVSLRARLTHIADVGAAVHEGSPLKEGDTNVASGNYNFTLGPGADAEMAGLCPGDSGGPVYRLRGGHKLVVVGVNSNYTLAEGSADDLGMPKSNWHTRLDTESRHDVAKWLRDLHLDAP